MEDYIEGKRESSLAAMEGDFTDRISELPEFIIHQILSCLSIRDAAQTSILSKAWLHVFSTLPILKFHDSYFRRSPQPEENTHAFFRFISNTLLRYRSQNLRIDRLVISVFRVFEQASLSRLLDESIGAAFEQGLKDLKITIDSSPSESVPYTLPSSMFMLNPHRSLLTSLTLRNCKLPDSVAMSTTSINAAMFPFLKSLRFVHVYVDDEMIRKLFSSCPLIENASFFDCFGFKNFIVGEHRELKMLEIDYFFETNINVEIEAAPSLYSLQLSSANEEFRVLKLGSSHNLKHLILRHLCIDEIVLIKYIADFPLLEVLNISRCHALRGLYVSSRSLKHLKIEHCARLVKAEIDAPSLLTLEYQGNHVLSLALNNASEELMTSLCIYQYEWTNSSTWFRKLRELLTTVIRAEVWFFIRSGGPGINFGADLDFRANPLTLEHQIEDFKPSSSVFSAFANNLFSISRPTTISSYWIHKTHVDFMKFLGNELMTSSESKCCNSRMIKCW